MEEENKFLPHFSAALRSPEKRVAKKGSTGLHYKLTTMKVNCGTEREREREGERERERDSWLRERVCMLWFVSARARCGTIALILVMQASIFMQTSFFHIFNADGIWWFGHII